MHFRRLILAAPLAACVLPPLTASAQDTSAVEVRPGSAIVDASRVAVRTDTFALDMGGVEALQLVFRTTALGDTALLRVERISSSERELDADSFAVRRATLAPLYAESHGISGSSSLTFTAGGVEGTFTSDNDPTRTISEELSSPLFYSNSVDMVLASLPLEAGRSFNLAVWSPEHLNGEVAARVVSRETMATAGGGQCSAWRVETLDEGGTTSVYWLEERTHALLGYSSGIIEIRIIRHPGCAPGNAP